MSLTDSIANHLINENEGLIAPVDVEERAKNHKMSFFYRFADPKNAEKHEKTLVDCSFLQNPLDERHMVQKIPVIKNFFTSMDLNHIVGTQEPSPYTYTMHNSDCLIQSLIYSNGLYMNYYLARCGVSSVVPGHPRTQWAHSVVFGAGLIRTTLATLIAVGGSLYTYEYLYTYAPFFRIKDPSTNGWKLCYTWDQSTFMARAISMMFYPLGIAFWTRSFKRFHFYTCASLFIGLFYEWFRFTVASGGRLFFTYLTQYNTAKEGRYGSLIPDTEKRMDMETQKIQSYSRNKYMNMIHSKYKEYCQDNLTQDNLPLNKTYVKYPNVYYNWQREVNEKGEKKYRYKTESFELPGFMDARAAI